MRRRAPFVWLVVALLALTGCSEPQQANDTLPTAPATTSAEPTLEPLGPADFPVPDDARVQTEAGAKAMAVYYFDLINRVRESLGPSYEGAGPLRELGPSCTFCTQAADGFDALAQEQVSVEGSTTGAVDFGTVTVTGSTADLPIAVARSAGTFYDAAGDQLSERSLESAQLTGGIGLIWNPGLQAWLVASLNLEVA